MRGRRPAGMHIVAAAVRLSQMVKVKSGAAWAMHEHACRLGCVLAACLHGRTGQPMQIDAGLDPCLELLPRAPLTGSQHPENI